MPDKCLVDPTRDCMGLAKAESLERKLEAVDRKMEAMEQRNSDSHQEVFQRLNNVEKENAVMDARYETIIRKLDELTVKVEALESKPAKRWDGLMEKALWAVAAAVIAFLLAQLGIR